MTNGHLGRKVTGLLPDDRKVADWVAPGERHHLDPLATVAVGAELAALDLDEAVALPVEEVEVEAPR